MGHERFSRVRADSIGSKNFFGYIEKVDHAALLKASSSTSSSSEHVVCHLLHEESSGQSLIFFMNGVS